MTGESDAAQAAYNRICNAEMDQRGVRVSPMTHDEARRRAVEAAKTAWWNAPVRGSPWDDALDAIAAFERAMADAGWRLVRDVGEVWEPLQKTEVAWAETNRDGVRRVARAEGWNACRRAMPGEGE